MVRGRGYPTTISSTRARGLFGLSTPCIVVLALLAMLAILYWSMIINLQVIKKSMSSTKEKTAAIKKALVPLYGSANVSVTKGSGTASHWITTRVQINIARACQCENPGRSYGDKRCSLCRDAYRGAESFIKKTANEVVAKLGGFSSYYSDDYSDSRPHDCHLVDVVFIRPVLATV